MTVNDMHVRSYIRALKARNLSPRTIEAYVEGVTLLRRHLADKDLAAVTADDVRGFIAAILADRSAATAHTRYRALQQFYKWAVAEDVALNNPMTLVSPPMIPDKEVAVLTIEQVKTLLGSCAGKTFTARRDNAIIRLFLEPGGARLSELTHLTVAGLDLDADVVRVLGKGRRARPIGFGAKTGQALDRYVRLRAAHPMSSLDSLWLGQKGPLTPSGIRQMVRRRAAQAGLPHLHPHMLRHTAAHEWLNAGGNETDAMALFGWKSRLMLERYGSVRRSDRAAAAARRLGLGDRY